MVSPAYLGMPLGLLPNGRAQITSTLKHPDKSKAPHQALFIVEEQCFYSIILLYIWKSSPCPSGLEYATLKKILVLTCICNSFFWSKLMTIGLECKSMGKIPGDKCKPCIDLDSVPVHLLISCFVLLNL